MRIIVSGGGTGGHVTPVLALCAALKARKATAPVIDYIGSGGRLERELVEAEGIGYHVISSGKFRRYRRGLVSELTDLKTMRQNAGDSLRILKGVRQARRLLKTLKPDVVFVKGGYVGLPVGLAASQLKIPLIIHESDTIMGLTNRVLASRARIVATGFPVDVFAGAKFNTTLLATGNPVRADILKGQRDRGRKHFGIDTAQPTLLVIGGSTGATALNEAVFGALAQLTDTMNVIHQTGQHDIDAAQFQRQRLESHKRGRYVPTAFMRAELADAYELADVVVSRCGANVLAELAALKKAVILVPLPGSANNHQAHNAQYIVRRGAARLLEQSRLTPRTLRAEVDKLIETPGDRRYLEQAIGKLAVTNAAELLAEAVVRIAEAKHG